MNSKPVVIAGCLLEKDGKFLLIQEGRPDIYGLWNIPAGHVDEGEAAEEAAVRETKEETGFDVAIVAEIGAFETTTGKTIHIFQANITGGELKLPSDELLNAEWYTYDEIKRMQGNKRLRGSYIPPVIQKYLGR